LRNVPQIVWETPALTVAKAESFQVPAIVAEVGPEAAKRFFEFFTVPIRNKHTRIAYYHSTARGIFGEPAYFIAHKERNCL